MKVQLLLVLLHFHLLLLLLLVDAESDAAVLLEFAKGIDKDPLGSVTKSWQLHSVDSNGCPSGWQGVECDSTAGRVVRLDLAGLALSGRIPANTLSSLPALTSLSLKNNFFSGPLPPDLASLRGLELLDLSNNLLTGELTLLAHGFPALQNLSLASNRLTGPIPDTALASSPGMLHVDLASNALTGGIPASLTNLTKLRLLDLSANQLNGSIPAGLSQLASLVELHLHHNRLSGGIPPACMLLRGVQLLDLSVNRLTGPLPWLATLLPPNLLHVNLSWNQLSGSLAPEEAANLFANKIQVLDLSNNALSGSLPSFEFVFSLRILNLNSNAFTGFVPPALLAAEASLLEHLDLSYNLLSGNVWAISAARLNTLNLSHNALSGELPPRLGSCAIVDISNNAFSGNLSVMRTWGNSLEWINLSNNTLTGPLPNQTAQLLRLISLDISYNKLTGEIPPAFASLPKLTSLDISGNTLFGSLPATFFYSTSLAALNISGNQLSGPIPLGDPFDQAAAAAAAGQLNSSPIRLLDLSANQFNGSIPSKLFTGFPTLQLLNLARNQLSGPMPAVDLSKLDHLQQLDLSANHLSGSVPGDLPPSLTNLKLSGNDFTGSIPAQLETKFPPSSFYPGNSQLQSNGFPAWANRRLPGSGEAGTIVLDKGHKKVSPAFKAGLIGGCTAAFVLALLVAAFVYHRRRAASPSKAQEQDKSKVPVFRIVEKDFVHHTPLVVSSPGAEQEKGKAEGAAAPGSDAAAADSKAFFTSMRGSEASSVDQQMNTAGKSPDKLAGDLFLLDTDVVFSAEELSRAPAEVLGRSSHGTSYKATLDNGHIITVKWLKEGLAKSKREFTAEAKKFGSIKHDNVLPLRGYYWGPREHEKLLLTDYVPYGSLADRLSAERRYPALTWPQRLRVAADIAKGVYYLDSEHKLPHGNLKACNVLLDGTQLRARLTDYGLHRLMTTAGTANQMLNARALGYTPPDLSGAKKPKPSSKSDVYAYGVILLEMLSGKSAQDIVTANSAALHLPDWVKLMLSQNRASDCLDPNLLPTGSTVAAQQQQLLELALRCVAEAPSRPTIGALYDQVLAIISTAPAN